MDRPLVEALAGFVAYMTDERRCSPRTVRAYGDCLRTLVNFAHGKDVRTVRAVDLRLMRAWLATYADRSPGWRQQMVSAARTWWRWLARTGVATSTPPDLMAMPRVPRRLPRTVLSPAVMRRIVESPDESPKGLRDRAVMEILWGSGLRVSELCALDLRSVRLDEGMVHVVNGKGGKDRRVPMTRAAVRAVRRWLEVRPDVQGERALFTTVPVRNVVPARISVREVQDRVKEHGAAAAHPELHPHAFRHAFATHLMDRGCDLRSVQAMLGHTRVSKTAIYLHTSVEKLSRVHRRALAKGLNRRPER